MPETDINLLDIATNLESQASRLRVLAETLTTEPALHTAAQRLDRQAAVIRELAVELEQMESNPNLTDEAKTLLHSIIARRIGTTA